MCSFSGWNTEKSLAKRSKHLLWNQRRITINTSHIQSFKIWWKVEITLTNHLLWVSICCWSHSPVPRHCCVLLTEERSPEPNSSDSSGDPQLEGYKLFGKVLQMMSKSPYVAQNRGNLFQGHFPASLQEYFPMPILIEFFKVPHGSFHWSESAIQINPQNILV